MSEPHISPTPIGRVDGLPVVLCPPIPWFRDKVHLRLTLLEVCEGLRVAGAIGPPSAQPRTSDQPTLQLGPQRQKLLARAFMAAGGLGLLERHCLLTITRHVPKARAAKLGVLRAQAEAADDVRSSSVVVPYARKLALRFSAWHSEEAHAGAALFRRDTEDGARGRDAGAGAGGLALGGTAPADDRGAESTEQGSCDSGRALLLLLRADTFGQGMLVSSRAEAALLLQSSHTGLLARRRECGQVERKRRGGWRPR